MSTNTTTPSALQLTIGSSTFIASFLDSPTVSAFRSLLPLNLQMSELNGNEKYADLSTTLPTAATNPGPISAGDLMIYGSRTLVLWYEAHSTTYTYTRVGSIQNAEGLAAAVGAGPINVGLVEVGGSANNSVSANPGTSTAPSSNQTSKVGASGYCKKVWLLTGCLGLVYLSYC